MADLKLFTLDAAGKATECAPTFFKREAQVQRLVEENLDVLFGIRFVASEYRTGKKHRGRIDSLGLDENNCPVIIEYKLDSKENVINQGLFYLDWLLDHRSEFQLLCMKTFGADIEIDWSAPRLLCIAREFTRYDEYAIGQINRNIELIRYQAFDHQILFELAKTVEGDNLDDTATTTNKKTSKYTQRTMEEIMEAADESLKELSKEVDDYLVSLGEDVGRKQLKYYLAYRRIKNFVCLEARTRDSKVILYCKAPFPPPEERPQLMRDVSNIGHYGTGEMELTIASLDDLEIAKPFLLMSYEIS